jgi:DeoR/GlpR family transcriptional regulator of sugar metabolism
MTKAGAAGGDVFARERQARIGRVIEEHGRARVRDLAAQFDVSAVTIRKDLARLERQRRVVRTHGGAVAVGLAHPESAFDLRERLQQAEKAAIAAAAVELVRDGETIAFDASTTALYVARALRARGGWRLLTVVTNGLRVASELAGFSGIRVLLLGGWVRHEAFSLVGGLGDGVFRRINVEKAIVGAAGFSIESGLSDATDEEAQIKRAMAGAAREVVAIIDHTKWGRASFATFCRTDHITRVLTDSGAPPEMVAEARAAGLDVRVVPIPTGQTADATALGEAGGPAGPPLA